MDPGDLPLPDLDWAVAVSNVLQQVHPGAVITKAGLLVMEDLVTNVLVGLITTAKSLRAPGASAREDARYDEEFTTIVGKRMWLHCPLTCCWCDVHPLSAQRCCTTVADCVCLIAWTGVPQTTPVRPQSPQCRRHVHAVGSYQHCWCTRTFASADTC